MKQRRIEINYEEYATAEELNTEDSNLVDLAKQSALNAYAPYSLFDVGATVRFTDGSCIMGNNQENASFPNGICAERVALFYASASKPGLQIDAIAITARSDQFTVSQPVPPCGLCRQAIAEYENKQGSPIRIIMSGESGPVHIVQSINDLLPLQFHSKELKKK
jgi:cytidine deaminase